MIIDLNNDDIQRLDDNKIDVCIDYLPEILEAMFLLKNEKAYASKQEILEKAHCDEELLDHYLPIALEFLNWKQFGDYFYDANGNDVPIHIQMVAGLQTMTIDQVKSKWLEAANNWYNNECEEANKKIVDKAMKEALALVA